MDRASTSDNPSGEGLFDLLQITVELTEERGGFGVITQGDFNVRLVNRSSPLQGNRAERR